MFDDDTERMQDRSDHLPVGRAEELFEIQKQLIQFARRQMQHQNPQVIRNIFGKLVVADFQSLAEFDSDLVSLFKRQTIDHRNQRASGRFSNHDRFADLDEIAQMGRDMQRLSVAAGMRKRAQHETDIGDLDRPRRACLEIVQIHLGKILSGEFCLRVEAQAMLDFPVVGLTERRVRIMIFYVDGSGFKTEILPRKHPLSENENLLCLRWGKKLRFEHDCRLQQGFFVAVGKIFFAVPA